MFWISPRFRQVASEVLSIKKSVYAPTTKALAEFHLERLISRFGSQRIRSIGDAQWARYVIEESKLRPRTFFDDRKFMRMVLFHAQSQKIISHVPRLAIPDLPSDAGREITPRELAELERHANPTLRFQIRIGYKMGLRLREMLRLRWDQVDWEKSLVTLLASRTKSRRQRRVPIPHDLLPEFEARRAYSDTELIFPSETPGRSVDSNKTAWNRCKEKAQVRARWHDLRHTCSTEMARRGVPEITRNKVLGMNAQTAKRYSHVSDEDLAMIAEKMSGPRKRS